MLKMKNVFALATIAFALQIPASAKSFQAIKGESILSYRMIHPLHKIQGISKDFFCEVDLSADTLSSKIKVSANINSFDSKNSSRDSHAMEMVEALKYPRVEFFSESIKPDSNGYAVTGKLNFHGITQPINFHVTPHFLNHKIEIVGGFTVKLSDFKVERPSLLFVPVEDKLTISFDLFALAD